MIEKIGTRIWVRIPGMGCYIIYGQLSVILVKMRKEPSLRVDPGIDRA